MRDVRPSLVLAVLLAMAGSAAAEPVLPRVITAPTAWLPRAGVVTATVGGARAGSGTAIIGVGLGIASVDVGIDRDVRGCTVCDPDADAYDATSLWLGRAAFRLGARQDALVRGMPAIVLGVRTTFAARGATFGRARTTEAYLVASRELGGGVRLHLGGALIDAAHGDREVHLGVTARPFAGLEWTPAIYPRTTLLADLAYVPRFAPDAIALEWVGDWGVRYDALAWASIELAVRHRENEGLADSNVMVRLNLVPASRGRKEIGRTPR